MTTRKTILFLIALVLLVVVIALQFAGPKPNSAVAMTQALVAKYDIPPFTRIRADDLQMLSVPQQGVGLVYTQTTALDGLLTTTEIRAGNAIQSADVIRMPESRMLGADTLVYSFYVSTARVIGGQLRPGHYIDVLVTRTDSRDEGGASYWLARGLWVVGVTQSIGPRRDSGDSGGVQRRSSDASRRRDLWRGGGVRRTRRARELGDGSYPPRDRPDDRRLPGGAAL